MTAWFSEFLEFLKTLLIVEEAFSAFSSVAITAKIELQN